ncbi:MAG: hypothetical protein NTV22_02430 [bacterium]|nr:hypothetical protein [bacterium]
MLQSIMLACLSCSTLMPMTGRAETSYLIPGSNRTDTKEQYVLHRRGVYYNGAIYMFSPYHQGDWFSIRVAKLEYDSNGKLSKYTQLPELVNNNNTYRSYFVAPVVMDGKLFVFYDVREGSGKSWIAMKSSVDPQMGWDQAGNFLSGIKVVQNRPDRPAPFTATAQGNRILLFYRMAAFDGRQDTLVCSAVTATGAISESWALEHGYGTANQRVAEPDAMDAKTVLDDDGATCIVLGWLYYNNAYWLSRLYVQPQQGAQRHAPTIDLVKNMVPAMGMAGVTDIQIMEACVGQSNDTTAANGITVVLGINCYQNFMNINQFDNIYCVADRYGPNTFGHGVTIVGYDDSLPTHDGTGALKLVNSFGPGWGANGFWWMSYKAVMDAGLSQRYAVFLTDTVGYQPQLLARVRVEHPTRDRVALSFLAGPAGAPLWQASFRSAHMTVTDQPFPDNNMVFDLTAAAPYIAGGQTDSVYFVTYDQYGDGESGAVRHFSAQYLPWGNIYPSADTPVAIPDDGSWVYVGTRIRRDNYDAGPVRVIAPAGVLVADSTYMPQVKVRNFGLSTISFRVLLVISASYQDDATVSNLSPGDSAVVQFLPWTAPGEGTIHVSCATALDGDEFPDNDLITESARVYYRDIALVEVTSPADTVDSGQVVWPRARVRNNGTQDETFLVYFRIPDEGYDHWSMARALPPGRETLLTFTPWTPTLPGDHSYAGQLVAGDMDPSNDVLDGNVYVRTGAGVEEAMNDERVAMNVGPTMVRGILWLPPATSRKPQAASYLLDISGRRVLGLHPRANDVSHLAPGVYFVRSASGVEREAPTVTRVVICR